MNVKIHSPFLNKSEARVPIAPQNKKSKKVVMLDILNEYENE